MIDLTKEHLLSLAQAAKLQPNGRRDRPMSLSCVFRWVLHGVRGPDGKVIRLEALRLGGRWLTSREALQRFAEAQTPCLDGAHDSPAPRPPSTRQRASERAAAELGKAGI
jgi:hypothetical protein